MARPRKKIDGDQVEQLAALFCTQEEIGSVVGCSPDTLQRRFAARMKRGRERGKASLRRRQYARAMEGNPTMLIWLGKQHLDQTDVSRVQVDDLSKLSDDELAALAAGKLPERK
jgi:hypothetical protein